MATKSYKAALTTSEEQKTVATLSRSYCPLDEHTPALKVCDAVLAGGSRERKRFPLHWKDQVGLGTCTWCLRFASNSEKNKRLACCCYPSYISVSDVYANKKKADVKSCIVFVTHEPPASSFAVTSLKFGRFIAFETNLNCIAALGGRRIFSYEYIQPIKTTVGFYSECNKFALTLIGIDACSILQVRTGSSIEFEPTFNLWMGRQKSQTANHLYPLWAGVSASGTVVPQLQQKEPFWLWVCVCAFVRWMKWNFHAHTHT